jgi:hypothetical protein
MNFLLIFNHHSLPFESAESADSAIPEFLKICVRAGTLGLSPILLDESIDNTWFRLRLSENYYWQDWYNQNQNSGNIDLIRAFRSISTKQPLFSSEDIGNDLELFEVQLNGDTSYSALCAAAWYDAPIASFPTRIPWTGSPIDVQVNTINENSDFKNKTYGIVNFFSLERLRSMEREILQRRDTAIQSGRELYIKRQEYYPLLSFCGKTEEQLSNWSYNLTLLEQIKESLTALNSFAGAWKDCEVAEYSDKGLRDAGLSHKVSGESDSVLKNRNLRKDREFWLPTGKKVVFEKHIKISQGFRIHFYPDNESKFIYVGYIGPHLRLK